MSSHEKDFPFLTKEEREFPRMVQVALVHNYCNARCYRCPIGLSNSNVQKFNYDREKMVNEMLPLDFFKLIADNMKGHPRTILRLHGRGEPLLNPGIFDMVSYAKMECEIPVVTMFTNGILLDENASSNLLVSHLDVFDISVDAHNAEIYFKNRGTNNWNRVLDNVKRLVDLREKIHQESRIIVSAVLDEEFESEKEHFKTFWEKLGADAAILRPYHNYAGRLPLSGQHGENSYTPCPQFLTGSRLIQTVKSTCVSMTGMMSMSLAG
ncbi:MAG: radical SAM protein [Chitinophagaceae bacterium]|nr:radical SAM protein [Chitinophagaceae bacterium]